MAYYTGQAASATELLSVLQNRCVENGWALSGAVLSKAGCFVEIAASTSALTVLGGTGVTSGQVTGFNSLSGTTNGLPKIYSSLQGVGAVLKWPLTYHLHLFSDPNEVYLVVNYDLDKYSYLAFGQLNQSLPGTGNWYAGLGGNLSTSTPYISALTLTNTQSSFSTSSHNSPGGIFTLSSAPGGSPTNTFPGINSSVHHGFDGNTWSQASTSVGVSNASTYGGSTSAADAWTLYSQINPRLPSAWNQESILLPIQPSVHRPENKVSILGQLQNARYINILNLEAKQILEIGHERWIVYPWFRKNSAANAASSADSAVFGWAIRYDGP